MTGMTAGRASGDASEASVEVTCSDEAGAGTGDNASITSGLTGGVSAATAFGAATVLSAVGNAGTGSEAGAAQLGLLWVTSTETSG